MLPDYYNHLIKHKETRVCRYFGLHRMKGWKNNKKQFDIYIIIMNNILLCPTLDDV